MQLAKFRDANGNNAIGIVEGESLVPLLGPTGAAVSLTEILESDDPVGRAASLRDPRASSRFVWPTFRCWPRSTARKFGRRALPTSGARPRGWRSRSRQRRCTTASMHRPGRNCFSRPRRIASPAREPLRIRRDSKWNVPEPELALVLDSRLKLVGFTVGNDMSSRDIEGENPLYLPQAKTYDACCGLGPWITLGEPKAPLELGILLSVRRDGHIIFEGSTNTTQMARSLDELIAWLGRDNSFPDGVFLLTGTGVVPDSNFTLHPADVVEITIDGLGTLINPIVQG